MVRASSLYLEGPTFESWHADTYMDNYIENAILHGVWVEKGDYKKANQAFDNILINFNILKKENSSLENLVPLLNDKNDSVRYWTAFFLLRSKESLAIKTLENVASKKGLVAFSAGTTLREWKNKSLSFDFLTK